MSRRPLGAIVSQIIVAGTSLLIALLVLRELGTAGLGTFSLLFGVLITVNSVQTGWIGDSLTVLDRFDPGIRRALYQSQAVSAIAIFVVTWSIGLLVDGVDVDDGHPLRGGVGCVGARGDAAADAHRPPGVLEPRRQRQRVRGRRIRSPRSRDDRRG